MAATSLTGTGLGSAEGIGKFKPENQRLCGIGPPGDPLKDTPRFEWEQIHGKLVTTITTVRAPICSGMSTGRMQVVERIPEGPPSKKRTKVRCCAIRYKACFPSC